MCYHTSEVPEPVRACPEPWPGARPGLIQGTGEMELQISLDA